MEWKDDSSSESEWTFEENKLFENALAEFQPGSPGFFENVASRVPWKSIQGIKKHYQALVEDVEMIESGRIPIPDYDNSDQEEITQEENPEMTRENVQKNSGQQRRRGIPWTEEEHQLFLMGLNKYGKGDWRSISRYYVVSKTPTQVASHAQKYFRRLNSSTPADRRRPSIHDIQTVNQSFFMSMAQNNTNNNFPGNGLMNNPMFNNNFPVVNNPMMNQNQNQPSGANPMGYMLPYNGNNQWG